MKLIFAHTYEQKVIRMSKKWILSYLNQKTVYLTLFYHFTFCFHSFLHSMIFFHSWEHLFPRLRLGNKTFSLVEKNIISSKKLWAKSEMIKKCQINYYFKIVLYYKCFCTFNFCSHYGQNFAPERSEGANMTMCEQ